MVPNPLAVWKAEHQLDPMSEGTKTEWAMLAEIWKLRAELKLMKESVRNESI